MGVGVLKSSCMTQYLERTTSIYIFQPQIRIYTLHLFLNSTLNINRNVFWQIHVCVKVHVFETFTSHPHYLTLSLNRILTGTLVFLNITSISTPYARIFTLHVQFTPYTYSSLHVFLHLTRTFTVHEYTL